MPTLFQLGRATALLALGLGLLVPACLRLDGPESFTCAVDGDCLTSERCLEATCRPREYCGRDEDCASKQICENEKCVPEQCTSEYSNCPPGNGCRFRRCLSSGCSYDQECSAGHCQSGECIAGPRLSVDGSVCDQNSECQSNICCHRPSGVTTCASICAKAGELCETSFDCLVGECCQQADGKRLCGKTCPVLVGTSCIGNSAACAAGQFCYNDKFCTKSCSKDADCGVSSEGNASVCLTRGGGKSCFPKCTSSAECNGGSLCRYNAEPQYCD